MDQCLDHLSWDTLSCRYMENFNRKTGVKSLREQQAGGGFSGAPIKIQHYMDVMKLLSCERMSKNFDPPVTILDVGSYLNLFSDFINNFDSRVSTVFHVTGIESSPQMCEISNTLFPRNELIQGDVREIHTLTNNQFDIVIFNNFFQLETPFSEKAIKEIFRSVDRALKPDGLIFYKYDNKRIVNDKEMVIVSAEGKMLTGKKFLPHKYVYSNERYMHFWYVIKKLKSE